MEYLINFAILFHEFYNFPYIDLVHILIDTYLSMSFLGDNEYSVVFLISNFTGWLLVSRKVNDFCVLTFYPATFL